MLSIQRSTRNIPTVKRDNFIQNFIISDKYSFYLHSTLFEKKRVAYTSEMR